MQLKEASINPRNKMVKTNTEKPAGIAEKKKSGIVNAGKKQSISQTSIGKQKVADDKKQEQVKNKEAESENHEKEKPEDKKEEKKKPVKTKPKDKKFDAVINGRSLPISTKKSRDICKFIRGKKIERAISELEEVLAKKRAVPMKGEIPHRKGKMMSGGYPKNATEHFIKLLKSLQANANTNEIENPFISEAVANIGQRPLGRFGRWQRKRTHIKLVAREKKIKQKNSEDKK